MSQARRVLRFSTAEVLPPPEAVLRGWDLPTGSALPERSRHLLDEALARLADLIEPRALLEPLTYVEFAALYRASEPEPGDTPVALVAPRAGALALFAATLGEAPTRRTRELFAGRDPALGWMLDAAASVAAERLADLTAAAFAEARGGAGAIVPGTEVSCVLPYSPGYCGWPLAGQRALFARLRPEEIGLTLGESCLMWPLKSVSGVLASGPPATHAFDDDFPFCRDCATHACRTRLAAAGGLAWSC